MLVTVFKNTLCYYSIFLARFYYDCFVHLKTPCVTIQLNALFYICTLKLNLKTPCVTIQWS